MIRKKKYLFITNVFLNILELPTATIKFGTVKMKADFICLCFGELLLDLSTGSFNTEQSHYKNILREANYMKQRGHRGIYGGDGNLRKRI